MPRGDNDTQHSPSDDDEAPEEISFLQSTRDAIKIQEDEKEAQSKQPKRRRKQRTRQPKKEIIEESEEDEPPVKADLPQQRKKSRVIGKRVVDLKRRKLEVTTSQSVIKDANRLYYDNPDPQLAINFKNNFLNDPKRVKRMKPQDALSDLSKSRFR
jgi:hypothetical protein